MIPVFTRNIVLYKTDGSSFVPVYTKPPGQSVVLRDLIIGNTTGSTIDFLFYIEIPGGTTALIWQLLQVPSQTTEHLELRQAIPEGGKLVFFGSAAGISLLATAYVFSS